MVKNYTDIQILERVKTLQGFTHMPKYLLVGVRSLEDNFNLFDDKFYFFVDGKFFSLCTGTTNPGDQSLLGGWRKVNGKGSAIVKADEIYYDVYQYGLHNGKMPCLRQVKNMKYFRDNNSDQKVNESGLIYTENAATNFHFCDYNIFTKTIRQYIGGWSHGCQVANDSVGYNKIIDRAKQDGAAVTYALLKEF